MAVRQVIPVSIGKNGFGKEVEGDRRTPVDVYRPTLFREDEQLIDFYGLGAYPLNYPNVYDRQRHRPGLENTVDFEHRHKAIMDRFGRYPHRNAVLGRSTTAAEEAFLKEPGSSF
ncbi:MAG: DUF924 family protein [Pseudohongiellaceae bacterium]